MKWVFVTALAVGGATLAGAGLGFLFRNVPERTERLLSGASAGIMLYSALFGLMLPAQQCREYAAVPLLIAGLLCGALFLTWIGRLSPRLVGLLGLSPEGEGGKSTVLFLLAMGIHHFPEGLAAGVSFGTGQAADVLAVAGGIALQNVPEGMVTVRPMLALGMTKKKALLLSVGISIIEAVGVLIGYFAVTFSAAILPFSLCFAAGTMIWVLLSDMVPAACDRRYGVGAVWAALGGMGLMMLLCSLL